MSEISGGGYQYPKAVLDAMGKRYLVEHQEAEDGSWWYDLYSDGFIRQGGKLPLIQTTYTGRWSVTLPKSISKLFDYGGTPFETVLSGCVFVESYTESTINWAMSNAHDQSGSANKQGVWWITGMI